MHLKTLNTNNFEVWYSLMVSVLLAFIGSCQSVASDKGPTLQPDRMIITAAEAASSVIFTAPHGLSARSGLDPKVEQTLKHKPSVAAAYIASEIELTNLIEQGDGESAKQLERAIAILSTYPSIKGDQVLGDWYLELAQRRDATVNLPVSEYRLNFQILTAFAGRYSIPVAQQISAAWLKMDKFEKRASMNYLAEAGRSLPDAIASLQELKTRDPASAELINRALTYMEE